MTDVHPPVLRASALAASGTIRHGFFTRAGGVSDGIYATLNGGIGSEDVAANVTENRARMASAMAVAPANLLTVYQIHSPTVVTVERPWEISARPKADGLVTKIPGLALGITTADCGPLLFADTRAGVIGAAHAGWRGAFEGIAEATILAMERCGADRDRIVGAIGPLIHQANYEVGPEFVVRFCTADENNERFFKAALRKNHALFDLAGYIAARLAAAGIRSIEDTGHCTYADPATFYSYRRSVHRAEPDYGRHISAIVLTDGGAS